MEGRGGGEAQGVADPPKKQKNNADFSVTANYKKMLSFFAI
jgi:hypothetical protein